MTLRGSPFPPRASAIKPRFSSRVSLPYAASKREERYSRTRIYRTTYLFTAQMRPTESFTVRIMRYHHIRKAEFIDRPNRFIANVLLDGSVQTVHVKNTGRCRELLVKGCTVYLEGSDNPMRRTKYA